MATLDLDRIFQDFDEPAQDKFNPIADGFTSPEDNSLGRSKLGENYWLDNLLGRPVFMPVRLGGILLPNPLVSISGSKTIVETAIAGRDGTVKEIISTNDYSIKVKCYVKDNTDLYPEDLVRKIVNLYKSNKVLTIECVLTDFFLQPKDNCVITDINIPEYEGLETMEVIELSLKSNRTFEILID